ncbi:leucine-rich repeat and guanylate kinase domain-containing protein-like [Actinia tenebrosa]|uniref:Leucine-rich repeat and guanylate kinase domain-containing protein-like n=1 Tax=Actinia tenebrosa TaxID=6105 RepID=A0A6P8HXD1_ACTTE|nr:leucine-rich repeat and guanylate kinase domain-containing protein-like [Actinia tenebrosa]
MKNSVVSDNGLAKTDSKLTEEMLESTSRISIVEKVNSEVQNVESEMSNVVDEGQQGETKTIESREESFEEEVVSVEYVGGLSDDMIADGLSQLGRSADGTLQVFLTLFLPGCNLTGIEPLAEFTYLQSVTLSYNSLTDLTPLGNMPNLIFLDVSHNKLTSLLDFKPPLAIREVNYSYNEITEIPDLSAYHSLVCLNLDYNRITEIQGLMECHNLKHLSLMHNQIEKIANLDNLPLQTLDLSYNKIKKIENLDTLLHIQKLYLAKNNIRSMKGLQNHPILQDVNLEENQIIDIAEVRYIRELKLLRNLNLLHNPLQGMPDYRLSMIYRIQSLTELDRVKITPDEKVAAINLFSPPAELIASRDHMLHVVRSLLQPTRIYDSTLPSTDTPYPMLVLCGPSGSGKRSLAKRLCQDFPDFFGLGVSHTTRPPRKKEENGEDHFFVTKEEFEADAMSGKFLQTCQVGSYLYGITRDAVEEVAREGLAAVLHMELEGVLSFKNTYFEPRYILIVPVNRKMHEERMFERGYYTDSQIHYTCDRVEMYLSKHRNSPGFFDMAINSDDLGEAYKRLKRLIIEYLGMTPPTTTETNLYSTSDETSVDTEESYPVGVKSGTSNTSMTITLAARTWSRPSGSSNVKNKTSTAENKTPVEELSLLRRKNLAKAAVAGVHVLSLDDLILTRQISSTGFQDSSVNADEVKRASTYPLGYDTSFVSMAANASSEQQRTDSNESNSEDEQTETSSLMSSARAYSERFESHSVDESAEDQDEQDGGTIDVMRLEYGSQASESVALSAGMEQIHDANSI